MYPFIRLLKEFFVVRNARPLVPLETHVSQHICWPWDLDLWMELNNGRTLTLYDLGRIPMAKRAGLITALQRNKWGLTVAGTSVRYRRRVRALDRITMKSRAVCWDEKFIYIEQSMTVRGEVTSHALFRTAVTGKDGIVSPDLVLEAVDAVDLEKPEIPQWISAWIDAEAQRPWPPDFGSEI